MKGHKLVAKKSHEFNKTQGLFTAVKKGKKVENSTGLMMELETRVNHGSGVETGLANTADSRKYYPDYHDGLRRDRDPIPYDRLAQDYQLRHERDTRDYDRGYERYEENRRDYDSPERYVEHGHSDNNLRYNEYNRYSKPLGDSKYQKDFYGEGQYHVNSRDYPTRSEYDDDRRRWDDSTAYTSRSRDQYRLSRDAENAREEQQQQLAQLREATERIRKAESREAQALQEVQKLSAEMRNLGQDNEQLDGRIRELSTALKSEEDQLTRTKNELQNAREAVQDAEARATLAESRALEAEDRLRQFKARIEEAPSEKSQLSGYESLDAETVESVDDKTEEQPISRENNEGSLAEPSHGESVEDVSTKEGNNENLDPHTQKEVDQAEEDAQLLSVSIIVVLAIAGTSCGLGTVASVAYMYRKNQKLMA